MTTTMVQRPSVDEVLDGVRSLLPGIATRARATAEAGRVPRQTVDELRETGLFRLMQPARFGGFEYGPASLARAGFELGRACGSTAWCCTIAVCVNWMVSFFALEAQQEVWEDPSNILAVSYTPTHDVTSVDGGYLIAGQWPWASGVDNASWLILSTLLPNEGAPPTPAWCLVPVGEIEIDHDSWQSPGLEGTGSKTLHSTHPIFVPQHRVLPLPAVMSGNVPGLAVPDNQQAAFGYPTFGPTALVSPIVGMAQGALESFTAIATDATRQLRPGVMAKVAESPITQRLIGAVSAEIDAARTLLLTSLAEGEAVVRSGGTLTVEQRTRIRRNQGFAGHKGAEAATTLFGKSGARAADNSLAVQRFWRDANTAALHATIDWDNNAEMYGTQQLGLNPVGIF
jgi:resorcinol 4-hydroxylase (FADH2)